MRVRLQKDSYAINKAARPTVYQLRTPATTKPNAETLSTAVRKIALCAEALRLNVTLYIFSTLAAVGAIISPISSGVRHAKFARAGFIVASSTGAGGWLTDMCAGIRIIVFFVADFSGKSAAKCSGNTAESSAHTSDGNFRFAFFQSVLYFTFRFRATSANVSAMISVSCP